MIGELFAWEKTIFRFFGLKAVTALLGGARCTCTGLPTYWTP